MSEIELLPCPFCGGKAEEDTRRSFRNFKTGELEDSHAISCTKCEADMMLCYSDHRGEEREYLWHYLRQCWNKRRPAEPRT